ncbi:hypothetical protein FGO68_gene17616 [Halteria grandinella]|uniref:Uncharacterized protein n=1 Tax=Halteria grandinella TaxID=5974 RepID=A0A8J8SYM7_HALGN|nr:hypothetical protein FGO68_gene17616 [Halteria grandinella]
MKAFETEFYSYIICIGCQRTIVQSDLLLSNYLNSRRWHTKRDYARSHADPLCCIASHNCRWDPDSPCADSCDTPCSCDACHPDCVASSVADACCQWTCRCHVAEHGNDQQNEN